MFYLKMNTGRERPEKARDEKMGSLSELIRTRKSVRSFDGRELKRKDLDKLRMYAGSIENPFGIPVEFVFLDAALYGLSSPVISGEKFYVMGKVEKKPYADVAFGFAFEKLVLYAWSLGIGTTWIGGTMKRADFEKAAGLKKGQMMPCVSPLGYPSGKHSIRETMMRKAIGADSRMASGKLFFKDSFSSPLTGPEKEKIEDLIEMVRWSPSAVNKQPWRILLKDGIYHFYEKKDRGYQNEATGDLQKIDVGIALCHFVMGAGEKGLKADISISNPGMQVPADMEYIVSVSLKDS